jgi:hypothetical protein
MSNVLRRNGKNHKPGMLGFASATSSGASAKTMAKPLGKDMNHDSLDTNPRDLLREVEFNVADGKIRKLND